MEASASRALMAATCAGVACFGVAGASPQKPRALMMSAGVCGFASIFCAGAEAACLAFAGWTVWISAEASWKVEVTAGLARGTGAALREADARKLRGIGALAATMLEWSTGEEAAGA